MFRRNRSSSKSLFIAIILGCVVLYNEFIVYELHRLKWALRECTDCVKILLVADPQILGFKNENYYGASLAIWDSDRYLSKTFSRALRHANPHVVIFLGDLMDEGHFASTEDFVKYKHRLDGIFDTSDDIMKIYLPGDNDIGGEEDSVSNYIHQRFKFTYTQPDTLVLKSVTFFKVNRLTHDIPSAPKDAFLNDYVERNTTNIVLTHMPLLFMPGSFVQSVLKELSPQIIFSAHEHKAMHTSLDTASDQLSGIQLLPPQEVTFYQLRLDMGDVHEIQIPTCSYRMGTRHMGYGLALINTQEKTLDFTVLWLPQRFPLLIIYIVIGSFVTIFLVLLAINNRRSFNYISYTKAPMV